MEKVAKKSHKIKDVRYRIRGRSMDYRAKHAKRWYTHGLLVINLMRKVEERQKGF